ncbi:hypothetical protein GH975_10085 [Litorivicinus lipolyticus]|uniref:PilC beta-propeller domain-containing protein n=1 Tax=Litorivicinus lipolyticus TaxID=418701 RepID=A0A5Q2QIK8_9GAMM|nr:PilC/PilY family type IV pilus protein [Litorivicinus lipolyticus]QGG80895.1 hypothetical protein GH975_10085 [Litorivicinus lipolyticus]
MKWCWSLPLYGLAMAAAATNLSRDYQGLPAVLSGAGTPVVMLAMSQDHQLFYKAYTDWDDLDGDAQSRPETTYVHAIEYFGYFDSDKCYRYDTTDDLFQPDRTGADGYCGGSGEWAGNFLNWATTTRIDAVRKILYGGARVAASGSIWKSEHEWQSSDGSLPAQTVLERAYLPNDAHSFAKYYRGQLVDGVNDIRLLTPFTTPLSGDARDQGITLCNTTRPINSSNNNQWVSSNVTAPPQVRVVTGNRSLWAANERWQCLWNDERGGVSNSNDPAVSGIDAYSSSPAQSDGLGFGYAGATSSQGNYVVRVQVCAPGLIGSENCKQYPDGSLKPVGLIQQYGDDDRVWFGLMTGSYRANKSGGVLRKNPGSLADEVDIGGDGRFLPAPGAGNIVATLDALRPVGYNHSDGRYNDRDNCAWGLNSFNNDRCRNWGNPLSEIVLECYRYLAGNPTPTPAFAADDSGLPFLNGDSPLNNMISASWTDPLASTNSCAKLNVIAFNASTSSYDTDELAGVADLQTLDSADTLTDRVGAGEGLHGQQAFVGRVAGDTDELCTPKLITQLSEVQGTCPDAPRLEGGYQIAGLAHHVNTTDLRPPLSPSNDPFPGQQTITTYGVALTPTLPNVQIPVPGTAGQFVRLLPACFNEDVGGNCGLVDFKVTQSHTEVAGIGTGAFYVNWEDSEQGGDFDQDMSGVVSYRISATDIEVTTDVFAESTIYDMGFGFVISGTTQDGFHAYSGIEGFSWTNPAGALGCTNCQRGDGPASHTFTLGSATTVLLQQPLYYAAKWGGFTDTDDDGTPNLPAEWDRRDNSDGSFAADGIPDNYFLAINPAQLNAQLGLVLEDIINRTAAGTGGAVVANSVSGLGAVYQALYQPQFKSGNESLAWVGLVHALFIDDNGRLREDGNGDGALGGYSEDPVVQIAYDALSDQTLVTRFESADGGATLSQGGQPVPLSALRPIWNARDRLATLSTPQSQRNYSAVADDRRYIITAGPDASGLIGRDQVQPFVTSTFRDDLAMRRSLDLPGSILRNRLVRWLRGQEYDEFRSRTAEFLSSNPGPDVWRLGDVIHSTPTPVGAPNAGYDARLGDTSYLSFKSHYKDRRTVVYVGANDGMLHAFNGGFWNEGSLRFDLQSSAGNETEHPLGSELWAYVPFNLLPHLKWLVEDDYPHVYYVDGRPLTFDARVFDPTDPDHPGGWGSVLAVTYRFGGGAYWVDWDGVSGNGPGGTDAELRARSSVVLFDITNPEQPPQLMAELTDSQLNDFFFTTAQPTLVSAAAPGVGNDWDNPSLNQWKLMFGAGPDSMTSATRGADAQVYLYDLASLAFDAGYAPLILSDTSLSFAGDGVAADWNTDGATDAVYLGVTGGTAASPTGSLRRLVPDWSTGSWSQSALLGTQIGQGFSAAPRLATDAVGQPWVLAGSGRLFVSADNQSSVTQAFYGIKEQGGQAIDFVDVTGVDVDDDGVIAPLDYTVDNDPVMSLDDLNGKVAAADGWLRSMTVEGVAPSGRVVEPSAVLASLVLFTEYVPDGALCQPSGSSRLWGLDFSNGVRALDAGLIVGEGDEAVIVASVAISAGLAFSPLIHSSTGEFGGNQVIVADDKGGYTLQAVTLPTLQGGRESWRQIEW